MGTIERLFADPANIIYSICQERILHIRNRRIDKSIFINSILAMKLHLFQRKNLRICMVKAMAWGYHPDPSNLEKELRDEIKKLAKIVKIIIIIQNLFRK